MEKIKKLVSQKIPKCKKVVNKAIKTSKNYIQTNILFMSFVILSVTNGAILRQLTVGGFFDTDPFLADLAIIMIIGALGYFIKPKSQHKYFIITLLITSAICTINSIYYTNYLTFTSISMLSTSTQLVGVANAVFEEIMEAKDLIFLIAPIILYIVHRLLRKNKYYEYVEKIEIGRIRALNTIVGGLIVLGFFLTTVTGTDLSRLGKQWNREYIVIKFGIYTYQINDVIASAKSKLIPLFGYDEALKEFREFYEVEKEVIKNKYTNILKGKNIIVIHAESIQNFLINKTINGVEVTPNLNRLAKEGIYASNFYAQESVGTSSDSEFTFSTSLLPASSGTVFVSYWDRKYESIQKLLNEKNYYTFSMHGNNGSFWNRNVVHINTLGYNKYFSYKDTYTMDEIIGLGISDASFFRQSVPIMKDISQENKNFFGTLIMLTNHTPFTDIEKISEFEVDWKYETINFKTGQKEIASAPYLEGTTLGSYIKSSHYADQAIGSFVKDLEAQGLLENAALVIYGDHDAKLKKSDFVRYYNYDPYNNAILSANDEDYIPVDYYTYELNRKVPFIIWSKNKKFRTEITEVMGMYDVLPTLANMMGLKTKYALGNDIFSVKENVVVFPDGNWLTNKVYYNSQKEEGRFLIPDEPVSQEYINNYNEYSQKLISISNNIIVHDLIKKTEEIQAIKEIVK